MKSGETKLFLGILIVAILLVTVAVYPMFKGGGSILDGGGSNPRDRYPKPKQVKADRAMLVPPGSHTKGMPNAPFTLVEFGDFECPTCKLVIPYVDKAMDQNKTRMNYAFHAFKVASAHKYSAELAAAAEAAGLQGKYWPMHQKLFDNQTRFEESDPEGCEELIMSTAKNLGLDMKRFRKDYQGPAVKEPFQRDKALGDKLDVQGTPTFFFVTPTSTTMLYNGEQMVEWLKDQSHWK